MIAQIKSELADWFQLLAKKEGAIQSAAEKYVQRGIVALHKALEEGEKEAVVLAYADAKKIEAELEKLTSEGIADLKASLSGAIKLVESLRPKAETDPAPAVVPPAVPASVPTPVDAPAVAAATAPQD